MESAAEVVFKFVSCLKGHHLESVLPRPLTSVCTCLEGSECGTVRAIRGPQIVHRRHHTQCKLSQRAKDFQRTAAFLLYSCARNPEELKIPHGTSTGTRQSQEKWRLEPTRAPHFLTAHKGMYRHAHLTMGVCSEKCVFWQFCHCANVSMY